MKTIRILLVLALLGAALAALTFQKRQGEVCSPTARRPWAAAGYEKRVSVAAPLPWPTATGTPLPTFAVTQDADSITVEEAPRPFKREPNNWEFYERVEAGPTMKVALPKAQGTTVELLYWRASSGPWLHPLDGTALEPQPEFEFNSPSDDALAFAIRVDGGPLRCLGPSLFDRQTEVSLSSSSTYGYMTNAQQVLRVETNTELKHRADLMLEVKFTYGPPEKRELRLEPGATASFGSAGTVQYLARSPGRLRSMSVSEMEYRFRWDTPSKEGDHGFAVAGLSSKRLGDKLQARAANGDRWSGIGSGKTVTEIGSLPASTEAIELRYLPFAARVQFRLPPPSSLPVLDDLLEAPLGDVRFDSSYRLESTLVESLQVERSSAQVLGLEKLTYPLAMDAATPEKLLAVVRESLHPGLHVDRDSFVFRTTRPSLALRLKIWAKELAAKLGI